MIIKIYFGDVPLFLADHITDEIIPYEKDSRTHLMKHFTTENIRIMLDKVQDHRTTAGIFLHSDVHALFSAVKQQFTLIQAAGGAVLDENDNMLFIYRRGKWDLPKGKLDEGENLEACAVREVEEETGLSNIELKKLIITTYHTYEQNGEQILKESFWYLMKTKSGQHMVPQLDEDIEKCEWVKPNGYQPFLQNTHSSIKDVVAAALPYVKNDQR